MVFMYIYSQQILWIENGLVCTTYDGPLESHQITILSSWNGWFTLENIWNNYTLFDLKKKKRLGR